MANNFKINPSGTEEKSLFIDNWAVSPITSGGGPSSVTNFYNGHDVPNGGYAVYFVQNSNPVTALANNDTELLKIIGELGGTNDTVSNALQWAFSQPNVIVANRNQEDIVTDDLIFYFDTGYSASISEGGTTFKQLGNSSINGGSIQNTPAYDKVYGGTLFFDGTNDHLELDDNLAAGKSEFTICMWVMITGGFSEPNYLYVERTEESGSGQYEVRFDQWIHRDNSTGIYAGSAITDVNRLNYTLPQNEFAHLALVYSVSGGFKKAYVNGVLADSSTTSIDTLTSTRNGGIKPIIGTRRYFAHFEGQLPIFQAYDRALTEAEVIQNYNAQKDRYVGLGSIPGFDFKVDPSDSNSYSGSETTLQDIGPNAITSTLYNGVQYSTEGGGSLLFDGVDDIGISNISNYNLGNTSFSVAVWWKYVNGIDAGTDGFIGGGYAGTGDAWYLGTQQFGSGTTIIKLEIWNDGSSTTVDPADIATGWHHYAATYDIVTGEGREYLDGVRIGIGSSIPVQDNGGTPLEIGAVILSAQNPSGQRSYYQEGYLGSATIWKRVLSDGEMSVEFQSQRARFGV